MPLPIAAEIHYGLGLYGMTGDALDLIAIGYAAVTGNDSLPVEGTLSEMVEAAHGRRKKGHAVGLIEEIETENKLDLIQLELLWRYMGLPTI